MKSRILQIKAIYISILAIGALFTVLFLRSSLGHRRAVITAGEQRTYVTIADTDELREKGLSDTPYLKRQTGKLFVFDQPGVYGFWMKDMHYPIDIVWIDEALTVVGVTLHASPESYPAVFYPPVPVLYALEVNADEAAGDNLAIGVQLHLEK